MSISAVILTYNEEKHITRCIESIITFVDKIYILDSFSTDRTLNLLEKYENVEVKQQKFVNHATQFNDALRIFKLDSSWIMRIDADEYVDPILATWISSQVPSLPLNVSGIYLNRYMTFMGRTLENGGMDSYWILRIWRNGLGKCEQRWMDEHIVLSGGTTVRAEGRLFDHNLNTLSWWAHKHVDYSTREAIDVLTSNKNRSYTVIPSLFGEKSERIRYLKNKYNKLPLFVRPFFYFLYRYFILMGFRDGKQGFLWCILQGFWYRIMVDAKVYEINKASIESRRSISEVIKEKYGYEI